MEKISTSTEMGSYNPYKKNESSHFQQSTGNTYYVRADLSMLKGRLEKGKKIDARIVLVLSKSKFLIRFLGNNYIMHSTMKFERFDEVIVSVEETEPLLKLKILPPERKRPLHGGSMDIKV
jgi:hypothetical protein